MGLCTRVDKIQSGSTFKVSVSVNSNNTITFQEFTYVLRQLNNDGKMLLFNLDGSFLKGRCKGEMLTTTWIVVDINNKPNWKWFFGIG